MIILDTNVASELMKAAPDMRVQDWLNRQTGIDLWTSAITIYELRWGIERLATGARRAVLEQNFDRLIRVNLVGRVATLDWDASAAAASLGAERAAKGVTVDLSDTLIAGIALTRRATIATRNIKHFEDLEVLVVNPWTA